MNKTQSFTLIEGTFTDEDAREILMNIFASKINFHKIKNWSSQERFGQTDEVAKKRIPALQNDVEKIKEIVLEAKTKNKRLQVHSVIHISLSEED